jgi:hypothetical protein
MPDLVDFEFRPSLWSGLKSMSVLGRSASDAAIRR